MGIKSKAKNIQRALFDGLKKEVKIPVYVPIAYGDCLKKRTILITGGTSGIGYSIALQCVRNGADVVITGRSIEKLNSAKQRLVQELNCERNRISILRMDQKEIPIFKNMILNACNLVSAKKIDTLVNNAGVSVGASIGATNEHDFMEIIETNLKGTYFLTQEFVNYLIENNVHGNILNISSVSGIRPAISPYMISKWGINGLTAGLAKKYISYGIVVNGIAPGPTATEMLKKDGTDLNYRNSPAGRFIDPIEIANLAVFLISEFGRMIVGDTVYMTGGCGNLTLDDINY